MLKFLLIVMLMALLLTATPGQKQDIRIGPAGPLPTQPEPLFLLNGKKIPADHAENLMSPEYKEQIDSVSIRADSVFDESGNLKNSGIVKIFGENFYNQELKEEIDSLVSGQ